MRTVCFAVEKVSQLKAAEALYAALCLKHGVTAFQPLSRELAARGQDGKPLERLMLSGSEVGPEQARACMGLVAGYPGARSVCFWACGIRDGGLASCAQLLRASADAWFKGSRLAALEIVADGLGADPRQWCAALPLLAWACAASGVCAYEQRSRPVARWAAMPRAVGRNGALTAHQVVWASAVSAQERRVTHGPAARHYLLDPPSTVAMRACLCLCVSRKICTRTHG